MALTVIFRKSGVSFEEKIFYRLSYTDTYNNHCLRHIRFVRVDGHCAKGHIAVVEKEDDDEEEHAEGEGPSSPVPRQSPVDHPILESEVGPSVRVPSSSHTVPSFSLEDDDMKLLAKKVVEIFSVQQQWFQNQVLQQLHQFQQY